MIPAGGELHRRLGANLGAEFEMHFAGMSGLLCRGLSGGAPEFAQHLEHGGWLLDVRKRAAPLHDLKVCLRCELFNCCCSWGYSARS